MAGRPLVSIIIVNWNGQRDLARCLASFKLMSYQPIQVVLVDNGSTDDSVTEARKLLPYIEVIANKGNLGFAKANNIGLARAKGEYILFLNNDTMITASFLDKLVGFLQKNPDVGCVQPKIYLMGRGRMLDAVGSFLTTTGFLDHFGYEQQDDPQFSKTTEIFSAKGACMLFPRRVIEKIGNFDESYFAYFEETDLCWRTWLAGFKVVYLPDAVIYHKGGATTHRLHESFSLYHSYKNRLRTLIKNLQFNFLVPIFIKHFFVCFGLVLSYTLLGRFRQAAAIIKAWWWNIKMLPDTLNQRRFVQKSLRRVSDRQLFGPLLHHHNLLYYFKNAYFSFFIAPRIRKEKQNW